MSKKAALSTELCEALRIVLCEARKEAGLSLGEVAALSGLNRQAITFIERGERRPTADTFVHLAIALGLRPSEAWARAEAVISAKRWKKLLAKPKAG
jgi:transcriptional regulator with XRE-family HTH domain